MMTFEKIRTEIQKYKQSSLIFHILNTLRIVQENNNIRYPIWNLLSLLKWTYLHAIESPLRKEIKPNQLYALLMRIEELEGKNKSIDFKNTSSQITSLKIILFQQSPLQEQFYRASIDRQISLFLIIKTDYPIEREFKYQTGLTLKDFFNYCFYTYLYLNMDKLNNGYKFDGILHEDYFDVFEKLGLETNQLSHFLDLLSIKNSIDVENLHRMKDEELQIYETTFLRTKPFIFFRGNYRLPYRNIFDLTISSYIYNLMKGASPDKFPEDFGKRLEKYLGFGLKENYLNFVNEVYLKKKYNLKKVVDYQVDSNILIECKAIELHPRSGILRKQDILQKELKSSVIKAYSQLLSTANAIDSQIEWFGIVVTYKETFIGFGQDAWNEFLKVPIEEFCNDNKLDKNILKPENLFFITVENWDYIMQLIKSKRTTLRDILRKGREMGDYYNQDRLMLMDQVLKTYFPLKNIDLDYLNKAHILLDIIPSN